VQGIGKAVDGVDKVDRMGGMYEVEEVDGLDGVDKVDTLGLEARVLGFGALGAWDLVFCLEIMFRLGGRPRR